MTTLHTIGRGAMPSAVILSFPAISPPRTRAAALFRQALQAAFRSGADNLDAFDAVVGEAIDADPARVAEAIRANGAAIDELRRQVGELEVAEALLAASVDRALTARERRGAARPLGAAETAALRAYLAKVAGVEEVVG